MGRHGGDGGDEVLQRVLQAGETSVQLLGDAALGDDELRHRVRAEEARTQHDVVGGSDEVREEDAKRLVDRTKKRLRQKTWGQCQERKRGEEWAWIRRR